MEDQKNSAATESAIAVKEAIKTAVHSFDDVQEEPGVSTLVIRHDAKKVIYERQKFAIAGILDTPRLYIEKRQALFNPLESHVIVNREKMTINLVTNEEDHFAHKINGQLEFHPKFIEFGINASKDMSPKALSKFLNRNRFYFWDKAEGESLVFQMAQYEAKINASVEQKYSAGGDRRELREQFVTTNLPPHFFLKMPMFKGMPPVKFEVEIVINPDNYACSFESPEASELQEEVIDSAIDAELELIKGIHPTLLITEE